MFAQLEFDPGFSHKTTLVLYRTKKDAQERRGDGWLLRFELNNEQLSELVIMQKIKVINTDAP